MSIFPGSRSKIRGVATTHAGLPAAADFSDQIWAVETSTGSVLTLNYKPSGLWYSNGISWTHLDANDQYYRTEAALGTGTTNRLVKSSGTSGNLGKETGIAVDDSNNMSGLASLTIAASTLVSSILDEDDMVSNSAAALATQQSIKAYADTKQVANQNLTDIAGIAPASNRVIIGDGVNFIGGDFDELSQDAVGAMVTSNFTYVDGTPSLDLSDTGASAGSYGSGTQTARITVDAKGRITSISQGLIAFPTTPNLASVLTQGNTSGGTNLVISAGDELRIRDSGLRIYSSVDGQLDIEADTVLDLSAPTVDIGQGFRVDLPSSGSRTPAFFVNTAGSPGVYFDRPSASTGAVVVRNSTTNYHTFGALNTVAGDVTHTDGTNSMTYDASLNLLRLSGSRGAMGLPRMTTTQRNATSPISGDMVYNTTTNKHQGYNGTSWFDFY